ncbi:putative sphingoid long-chain base transporter RSB1 [Aaosphaeria arxii CBS 175.79]|uniref:Putative sphingoid long-chain base transporter RSB1 n=1 Tax=Aaosphaeria arxii CBS 175.79 TaxID=1450172 RepID=A0A6A5Y3H6_9PLEO|nr:putative sphingoid long-chain base transporter RSB1 [Aaosphaeria arxii CBS 175.79]KAF2019773.1 putative sphingoid long-chain base transporter RSB1 [Aaosphaeria arxii CBS 175.79]
MASIAYSLIALVARDEKQSYNDRKNFRDSCTLDTCPLALSYWGYRPSLAANILFTVLFGISTILFIGQGVLSRRFLGFTIAMVSGCALEVIGYIGRDLSYYNPFAENPFLIQIICLTIAPAFLAAGIYLCLSRIVLTFGPQNSRIKPLSYPRIFIPCDVASLLLQAAGGGLASAKSHADEDPTTGNNIMIAGLAVQVFTLLIFICLALDFSIRTFKRVRQLGAEGALDPTHAKLRQSWAFQGFLVALSFATLCIFTRSVYRVAELSEGWTGRLIKTQSYFIGLEGAIISAGVLALNFFHPGLCFREGYDTKTGSGCFGRKKKVEGEAEMASL